MTTEGPVLLVIGGTASRAAITRSAELAAGGPVTVLGCGAGAGVGAGTRAAAAESEKLRRAVAQAMSALENTGVMALGHIAVTGSPVRAVARAAKARGARTVVLDHARKGAAAEAAELRRRMYGTGIAVVTAADGGRRRVVSQ